MRQITRQMREAFLNCQSFNKDNTKVVVNQNSPCGTLTQIYLHNNLIAEDSDTGFFITNAGWFSNVTKERLNALPNVSICQKKGVWYLNGNKWDGQLTNVRQWVK